MRLTFLGTGTSFGIPVIGCGCGTCTSDDPRDRRSRHGALVSLPGGRLLVDTPPELRLQLLSAGVSDVDAVWITHLHADHVHGIDDLRIFSARRAEPLTLFAPEPFEDELRSRFPYIFDASIRAPSGSTTPELCVRPVRDGERFDVLGAPLTPLSVPHGATDAFGFRVGDLGYVTDGKRLPETVVERLRGVRVLVLNALWFGNPHPTHFNVEEAVDAAESVGAERTFLIHLTHRVRHEELLRRLPPGVEPAYDGLTVEI